MNNEFILYKVGDIIKPKRSRTEYIVVSTFEDGDKFFFVAKKKTNYGWSYSNVFGYNENGEPFLRS